MSWKMRLLVVVPALGLLGGCAAVPTQEGRDAADIHGQQQAATRALPNTPLTPEILYYVLLGEVSGHRGDLATAVKALTLAAEQTRDPRLAERATQAAMYARNYADAEKAATLWIEIEPDNAAARESMASALMVLGRPAQAQLHLERVLVIAKKTNSLGNSFLRIAGLLSRQGNRNTALEVMESLVNLYPENASARLALAHLGVRADNKEKALQAADAALKLKPGWEDAALYKARILVSNNESAMAEAFYKDFLDDYSNAGKLRLNYARFLVDRKQWERASKQFKYVIKNSPKDADAILAVGLLSMQAERLDDAEEYLKRHLQLKPDSDQTRLYLGQVADKHKDYESAIAWYEDITESRLYFDAQSRLAVSLARSGKLQAGRDRLHKLIPENDAHRSQVVLAEEQILREARLYPEAMSVLTKALKVMPEDTDVRYARALIAEKLDKLKLLESDLRRILKKDKDNVHALNALGYTLADRTNRYQEAYELLKRALKLKPDDAFVLDSMGWVQYRLGNYKEAVLFLRRALEIRHDAEISAHLGEVLWMVGERRKAEIVWKRALKQTPDNESLQSVIRKFTQ
jgi:tetratricopeptide (TPR) repeat protein